MKSYLAAARLLILCSCGRSRFELMALAVATQVEWSDFVSDFVRLTDGLPSPLLYRKWAGVSMVAAALERRVWAKGLGGRVTFPNLYIFLVGPPGSGKFIIEDVRELMGLVVEQGTKVGAFRIAPDNMTKASLIDALAKAKNSRLTPDGPPYNYHSLYVPSEEVGVLIPEYDQAYIHTLNGIFNNRQDYSETRRTGAVREINIENPQLNLICGAQPVYLATTFPEEAWNTGFARRILLVYSPEPPEQELFDEFVPPPALRKDLLDKLSQIAALQGQCKWTKPAAEMIAFWHRKGGPPKPEHSKLIHYVRSRTLHAIKLAIVSAISRTGKLIIDLPDVRRSIEWLLEIEHLMPDIFRAMVGRSDAQVLDELYYYVEALYRKAKNQPVHGSLIERFLALRVPSDKIQRIRDVAERAEMIVRVGGEKDLWVPKARRDVVGIE